MLTIQKVKEQQGKIQPVQLPLKCMAALLLPPTTYIKDGVEKKVQSLVLCDNTGYLKASSFDVTKTEHLKDQSSIILKNFISKSDSLIITTATKVFTAPPLQVSQTIITQAVQHLRPPTPPPSTSYNDVKTSPLKSLKTVVRKLIQDESPRQVLVKGVTVDVRTIMLENKGENIKVSLWKQFATHPAKAGDFVTATNLVVTEYQKEKQLSSTSRTQIQLTTPPDEQLSITILAFERNNNMYELLSQLDGDTLGTFTCSEEHVQLLLPEEDPDTDNSLTLSEQLLQALPGFCQVMVNNTNITTVLEPITKLSTW